MAKYPLQSSSYAQAAGRNIAINGNFDFWQRGISAGLVLNNISFFFADRFRVQNTATSNVQVDRSTDVPTLAQSGFQSLYSMKLTNSASPASPTTAFVNIRYTVEGQDYQPIHGRPFRIQFWVKTSVPGTYSVNLRNGDGTRNLIKDIVINAANTWERKILDFVGDTTGPWLFDNQAGLRFILNLQVPAANRSSAYSNWATDNNTFFSTVGQAGWNVTASSTFFIAQFAILPGYFEATSDAPFRRAGNSIQQELKMCQRYYEKSYNLDSPPGTVESFGYSQGADIVNNTNTSTHGRSDHFKVSKRNVPTMAFYSRVTGQAARWDYVDGGSSGTGGCSSASGGIGSFGVFFPTFSSVANRAFMSYGHWTADSEI